MDEKIIAALIGLVGVLLGLFIRDIYLQLHLFNVKRKQELEDLHEQRGRENRDLAWQYAEPLKV